MKQQKDRKREQVQMMTDVIWVPGKFLFILSYVVFIILYV